MSFAEIERINADLQKALRRVADIQNSSAPTTQASPVIVPVGTGKDMGDGAPSAWHQAATNKLSMTNGDVQWLSQLKSRQVDVARLELELVHAMLPTWGAAAVIEAMKGPRVVTQAAPPPTVVHIDDTRQLLETLLLSPDKFFSRTALKELIE